MTVLSVGGKGGTGKSTIAALLIRAAVREGISPVLVIDADPNSTLPDLLGVTPPGTVGEIIPREGALSEAPGDKRAALEAALNQILAEEDGFDLLVMGRPEGPGCYCYVNHLIKDFVGTLHQSYPLTVIDNEAGLEHLARHTDGRIDHLLLVSDPSRRGLETARRVLDLAVDMNLAGYQRTLVVNRVSGESEPVLPDWIPRVASIPHDPFILTMEKEKRSVFSLPETSPAVVSTTALIRGIL